MLMVDLIELIADHRFEQVRKFDGADPLRLQDKANTFHEGVEVCDLGKDIVTDNEVGLVTLFGQLARRSEAKERHQCRNATRLRGPGNVRCWIDAKDGNTLLDKELYQIPVVAAEF